MSAGASGRESEELLDLGRPVHLWASAHNATTTTTTNNNNNNNDNIYAK